MEVTILGSQPHLPWKNTNTHRPLTKYLNSVFFPQKPLHTSKEDYAYFENDVKDTLCTMKKFIKEI